MISDILLIILIGLMVLGIIVIFIHINMVDQYTKRLKELIDIDHDEINIIFDRLDEMVNIDDMK